MLCGCYLVYRCWTDRINGSMDACCRSHQQEQGKKSAFDPLQQHGTARSDACMRVNMGGQGCRLSHSLLFLFIFFLSKRRDRPYFKPRQPEVASQDCRCRLQP